MMDELIRESKERNKTRVCEVVLQKALDIKECRELSKRVNKYPPGSIWAFSFKPTSACFRVQENMLTDITKFLGERGIYYQITGYWEFRAEV